MLTTVLAVFVSGLLVGMVGAFLGIGGGVIIVPLLSIVFKLPVHEAVATSLAIVVVNSLITSRQYLSVSKDGHQGAANISLGIFVALFSVSGSLVGSMISLNVSASVIYLTLGLSQFLTMALMFVKSRFKGNLYNVNGKQYFPDSYYDGSSGQDISYNVYNPVPTVGVSLFSGVLSGLVGVGGGVMIVPAMNIFSGVPMKAATATSTLTMGFTAAAGGMVFFLHGYTNAMITMIMVPAVYIGSKIAVKLAVRVSSKVIYNVFMVFLFFIACQMIYRGISN